MKFTEALPHFLAGKTIRRKEGLGISLDQGPYFEISRKELKADDWEVVHPKIEITREDLIRAWDRVEMEKSTYPYWGVEAICKELGL